MPDKERIKQLVCEAYLAKREDLFTSTRGTFNEPRNVAIYLTRQLRRDGLREICGEFGLKKYSSASSVIERVKEQISKDRNFSKRVKGFRRNLIKLQPEI